MVPLSLEEIQQHLSDLCQQRQIVYEGEAISLLALAAEGWVGRARRLLKDVAAVGPVSLSSVRSCLDLARGEDVVAFALAALGGEVDKAFGLSAKLGSKGLATVQSFFRTCFLRYRLEANEIEVKSALHIDGIASEDWQAIGEQWILVAGKRSAPVADCVREAMTFWSLERDPVRWKAALMRFDWLLRGTTPAT